MHTTTAIGAGRFAPSPSADLHLGKAATFRRAGIPVPEGTSARDLARLATLVRDTGADRLLILGDLFHARVGCTERVLSEFTATRRSFPRTRVTRSISVSGCNMRAACGPCTASKQVFSEMLCISTPL